MFTKLRLGIIFSLLIGLFLGVIVDSKVNAVRQISIAVRSSIAQAFQNHVNNVNVKLKKVIKNQNKLIRESNNPDSYTDVDASGLEKIEIVDEK